MKRPEQIAHKAIVQHLNIRGQPGLWFCHIPNGGWRSPVEAKIFAGLGVKSGAPDLILIREGQTYALEIKAANGRLSPAQQNCHEEMRRAGAVVETAIGLDAALKQLEEWKLLRGKAA